MKAVLQLRDVLLRMMDASFERELLAACAPRNVASPEGLDAFEGLLAASLISTGFWLAVIVLLRG